MPDVTLGKNKTKTWGVADNCDLHSVEGTERRRVHLEINWVDGNVLNIRDDGIVFDALEQLNIRWWIGNISHAFVESDMGSSFDLRGDSVVPIDIFHCLVITKENTG